MTNVRVASSARPAGLPPILVAASFGFTIVQLDVTIVNVALDAIGREFGAPTASLQWVVDAYTLLLAALLLSAGATGSDRDGLSWPGWCCSRRRRRPAAWRRTRRS